MLLDSIRRKRPEFWRSGKWFLLHDNARPHTAIGVVNYLSKKQVTVIPHPPYFLDVSPCDYFLFLRLKQHSDVDDIQKSVEQVLEEAYKNCFNDLVKRWNKCIDVGGEYFEGLN